MRTLRSRYRRVLCAAAGGLIVSTASLAEGQAGQQSANAELKMMDTNQDGKVSAVEHAAGAQKMFEMMDADKDGKVTVAEMDAAHARMMSAHADKPGKPEMSSAQKIKVIDTDGDGALSAAEHSAGSEKMFAKMDTDKDGSLTAAEIQAGHEKMMTAKRQ
jgi:Ca2+-binding EF-hand superfamily protein